MSAWGPGIFENDSALDYMGFLEDAEAPQEAIGEALDNALATDYLDYDDAAAALVAAAYVDAVLNGTRYSTPDMEDGWAVDDFPSLHPGLDLSSYRESALKATEKVLGEDSEMAELMQENEDYHQPWQEAVQALQNRLRG